MQKIQNQCIDFWKYVSPMNFSNCPHTYIELINVYIKYCKSSERNIMVFLVAYTWNFNTNTDFCLSLLHVFWFVYSVCFEHLLNARHCGLVFNELTVYQGRKGYREMLQCNTGVPRSTCKRELTQARGGYWDPRKLFRRGDAWLESWRLSRRWSQGRVSGLRNRYTGMDSGMSGWLRDNKTFIVSWEQIIILSSTWSTSGSLYSLYSTHTFWVFTQVI